VTHSPLRFPARPNESTDVLTSPGPRDAPTGSTLYSTPSREPGHTWTPSTAASPPAAGLAAPFDPDYRLLHLSDLSVG
jgi:hypothetical protein